MKTLVIVLGIVIVAGAAFLFIAPIFNTIERDDSLPDDAFLGSTRTQSGVEKMDAETRAQFESEMEKANQTQKDPMDEPMPAHTEEMQEEASISADTRFAIMGTLGHPAEGFVRIVPTSSGTILRYEEFETINGPRLHVYLAKDLNANEFVDLGPIRGTRGNINYEVPAGVDVSAYRYVMVWCVPFGVLFNYAEISL